MYIVANCAWQNRWWISKRSTSCFFLVLGSSNTLAQNKQTVTISRTCMNIKVIYPKYSKHWPYLLAATIDCGSSKILNCGLNHGLLLLLFKVFLWKHILDWNEISGLKSRMLYCLYCLYWFQVLLDVQVNLPETNPFLSAQMSVPSIFFWVFLVCTWDV